jgi:hypothetical protein
MYYMSKERVVAGLIDGEDICRLKEAVCVQVEKVYDHCREKDCIEDAEVDFCEDVQCILDKAIKVRVKDAEVVKVLADLDDVPFRRGFFTVNVRYKIKLRVEFCFRDQFGNLVTSEPKVGFVWFNKTVFLFGSEGQVKIFSTTEPELKVCSPNASDGDDCGVTLQQDNLPIVKVEVAEPLVLNAQIKRIRCHKGKENYSYEDNDGLGDDNAVAGRRFFPPMSVVVTIGLFSIIKLTRMVQLLIPAFDFCIPTRECVSAREENACDLFDTIDFPFDQFFPPQIFDFEGIEEKRDRKGKKDEREERIEMADDGDDRRRRR